MNNFETFCLKYLNLVSFLCYDSDLTTDEKEELKQELSLYLYKIMIDIKDRQIRDKESYIFMSLKYQKIHLLKKWREYKNNLDSLNEVIGNADYEKISILSDNSSNFITIYEFQELLLKIESSLTKKQYIIFEMKYLKNLSNEEIASELSITPQAVSKTLKIILRKLDSLRKEKYNG